MNAIYAKTTMSDLIFTLLFERPVCDLIPKSYPCTLIDGSLRVVFNIASNKLGPNIYIYIIMT